MHAESLESMKEAQELHPSFLSDLTFLGKKRFRRIQNGVFHLLSPGAPAVTEFCGRWIVYNFCLQKNLAQKWKLIYDELKFESKCLQKFYVLSK